METCRRNSKKNGVNDKTRTRDGDSREIVKTGTTTDPLYLFLNPNMSALLLLDLSSILASSSSQSRI